MSVSTAAGNLAQYFPADLSEKVGEPDVFGPLTVFPVFGFEPNQEYASFAQGLSNYGVIVKELDEGARVNDLLVINPSDKPVLLFEGEEVLGAQQNRTFDTSVLVAARSQLQVPVSCVEAGRWDGSRSTEHFAPAPQAAYPELRRIKNEQARDRALRGEEARAVQGHVWAEVAQKSARMSAFSETGAMHDVYEARRERLNEFTRAIKLHDGQCGAIAAVGGKLSVLDWVSRPEVFATLHGPLVQGYALDALECGDEAAVELRDACEFAARVHTARISEHDGIGLGRDARFKDQGVSGAALVAGNEAVQVTGFGERGGEGGAAPARAGADSSAVAEDGSGMIGRAATPQRLLRHRFR